MGAIFGVILGGLLAYLITQAGPHVLAFDLLFVVGWLAATALHEIGHAVAAATHGFRVISIIVGPLYVTRMPGARRRVGLRPIPLGGRVYASPRAWTGDRQFRRDFAWFVAAGPATSLIAGAVGLLLTRRWDTLWVWSLISLVIGVTTLIPTRYPTGLTSDGEKLRQLRGSESADLALMALRMQLLSVRPRDWDAALVDAVRTESENQGGDAIDATILLYHYTLDGGDLVGAGAILQRLIDYTCGDVRWPRTTISREVGLEAALFEAAWRDDLPSAQAWLACTPSGKRKPITLDKLLTNVRRGNLPVYRATIDRLSSSSPS